MRTPIKCVLKKSFLKALASAAALGNPQQLAITKHFWKVQYSTKDKLNVA